MSGFKLFWIYLFYFGTAKKICNFHHIRRSAILKCTGSPTADDVLQARKDLEYNKDLSGITGLSLTRCRISNLSYETFDFHAFIKITFLGLGNNRLTSLPENLFNSAALTDLKELDLEHNELGYLSSTQFAALENLHTLKLGYNNFTTFKPGLFRSNPISDLHINNNKIELLPDDFLTGNISKTLKKLLIGSNKLKKIPQCIFKKNASEAIFPELKELHLGRNNISKLPNELLSSTNWSLLSLIDLSFNQLETLPQYIFHSSALSRLEFLTFSHNRITVLEKELFTSIYLQNLTAIDFSYNNITDIPIETFHSHYLGKLQKINFGHNKISELAVKLFGSPYLPNLNIIDFSYNQINSIPSGFLENHRVCLLNLAKNKISSLGDIITEVLGDASRQRSCKRKLNVSYNVLTVQQTNFIELMMTGHINGYLDLSFNNISKFVAFPETHFVSFPEKPLDENWLNISGNQRFSVINLVKTALEIDLNEIDMSKRSYFTPKSIFHLHVLIQAFPYEYNCNCEMMKYIKLQKTPHFKGSLAIYEDQDKHHRFLKLYNILNKLKCGSPNHLQGKYLSEVKEIELQCEHSKCTDNKKCTCTETPSNDTIKINCSDIQIKRMPLIKQNLSKLQIYLDCNEIYKFPIADITFSVNVDLLDLSYNFITNIPDAFFSHYPNITHLNLVGNHLTTLPTAAEWNFISSLEVLEFRKNNFTCNCSGLQLKETLGWLNAKPGTTVTDLNQIKCSFPTAVKDKVIYNLSDSLFGCPFVNLVFIMALTLSLLLFFSVLMFITYFFRYYISLFLFIHFGWRFWYSYTEDETLYDAFISYSSKDSDWVIDQLMNPLENLDPPYNLCLHERDFLIGVPICDNISKAIEGSKCTICVVSKNWLESDWCQFEFRVAHCLATVEKQIRLLVILKEEMPEDKIKGDLKFYMKTFTYLDAANTLFWSRLLNDLPRPDGDNIREENKQLDVIELV